MRLLVLRRLILATAYFRNTFHDIKVLGKFHVIRKCHILGPRLIKSSFLTLSRKTDNFYFEMLVMLVKSFSFSFSLFFWVGGEGGGGNLEKYKALTDNHERHKSSFIQ